MTEFAVDRDPQASQQPSVHGDLMSVLSVKSYQISKIVMLKQSQSLLNVETIHIRLCGCIRVRPWLQPCARLLKQQFSRCVEAASNPALWPTSCDSRKKTWTGSFEERGSSTASLGSDDARRYDRIWYTFQDARGNRCLRRSASPCRRFDRGLARQRGDWTLAPRDEAFLGLKDLSHSLKETKAKRVSRHERHEHRESKPLLPQILSACSVILSAYSPVSRTTCQANPAAQKGLKVRSDCKCIANCKTFGTQEETGTNRRQWHHRSMDWSSAIIKMVMLTKDGKSQLDDRHEESET
jgi:hypothetical protein